MTGMTKITKLAFVAMTALVFTATRPVYAFSLDSLKQMVARGHSDKKQDQNQVVVYLKNGNAMSGIITHEDPQKIVVNWQGGEIALGRNEIAKIERDQHKLQGDGIVIAPTEDPSEKWSYKNNPVVKLTNGQVIDASVSEVKGETVVLKQDLGEGAYAEHDIEKKRIESLEFKPIRNEESKKIEAKLKEQFPKMRFHQLGMITLITDSEGSALKNLKQILRDQEIVLYFDFADLLKNHQPKFQHYVVVFDRISDYFEYALTDGIPAWLCPGYFSPTEKILFMMNLGGQEITDSIYQVVKGVRDVVNDQANAIKHVAGSRRDAQIEGLAHDFNAKWETAMAYLSGIYTDISVVTLRHEFTHEFLHDWGLQTIIVSEMKEKDDALIKKKKELFETKDIKKKKELLMKILEMRRNSDQDIKIEASNSWFVEGLAEYEATTAVGERNDMRLYELKEARRKKELWPIEQLTVYKMGSFPGVTASSALSAYAQSWSFVGFLMKNYRKEFLSYLERMTREKPSKDDDLKWLIEALGKDLHVIEKEWQDSIDALPNVEDPQIEQMMRVREIFNR